MRPITRSRPAVAGVDSEDILFGTQVKCGYQTASSGLPSTAGGARQRCHSTAGRIQSQRHLVHHPGPDLDSGICLGPGLLPRESTACASAYEVSAKGFVGVMPSQPTESSPPKHNPTRARLNGRLLVNPGASEREGPHCSGGEIPPPVLPETKPKKYSLQSTGRRSTVSALVRAATESPFLTPMQGTDIFASSPPAAASTTTIAEGPSTSSTNPRRRSSGPSGSTQPGGNRSASPKSSPRNAALPSAHSLSKTSQPGSCNLLLQSSSISLGVSSRPPSSSFLEASCSTRLIRLSKRPSNTRQVLLKKSKSVLGLSRITNGDLAGGSKPGSKRDSGVSFDVKKPWASLANVRSLSSDPIGGHSHDTILTPLMIFSKPIPPTPISKRVALQLQIEGDTDNVASIKNQQLLRKRLRDHAARLEREQSEQVHESQKTYEKAMREVVQHERLQKRAQIVFLNRILSVIAAKGFEAFVASKRRDRERANALESIRPSFSSIGVQGGETPADPPRPPWHGERAGSSTGPRPRKSAPDETSMPKQPGLHPTASAGLGAAPALDVSKSTADDAADDARNVRYGDYVSMLVAGMASEKSSSAAQSRDTLGV